MVRTVPSSKRVETRPSPNRRKRPREGTCASSRTALGSTAGMGAGIEGGEGSSSPVVIARRAAAGLSDSRLLGGGAVDQAAEERALPPLPAVVVRGSARARLARPSPTVASSKSDAGGTL